MNKKPSTVVSNIDTEKEYSDRICDSSKATPSMINYIREGPSGIGITNNFKEAPYREQKQIYNLLNTEQESLNRIQQAIPGDSAMVKEENNETDYCLVKKDSQSCSFKSADIEILNLFADCDEFLYPMENTLKAEYKNISTSDLQNAEYMCYLTMEDFATQTDQVHKLLSPVVHDNLSNECSYTFSRSGDTWNIVNSNDTDFRGNSDEVYINDNDTQYYYNIPTTFNAPDAVNIVAEDRFSDPRLFEDCEMQSESINFNVDDYDMQERVDSVLLQNIVNEIQPQLKGVEFDKDQYSLQSQICEYENTVVPAPNCNAAFNFDNAAGYNRIEAFVCDTPNDPDLNSRLTLLDRVSKQELSNVCEESLSILHDMNVNSCSHNKRCTRRATNSLIKTFGYSETTPKISLAKRKKNNKKPATTVKKVVTEKKSQCARCDELFDSRRALTLNQKRKLVDSYEHVCTSCNTHFNDNCLFTKHFARCCKSTRNHPCEFCNKVYRCKPSLNYHMKCVHNVHLYALLRRRLKLARAEQRSASGKKRHS